LAYTAHSPRPQAIVECAPHGAKIHTLITLGIRHAGRSLAAQSGIAVLRYDAEVYESLGHLAEALLGGAAKNLTPTLEKAREAIKRFASKLKPHADYELADQTLSITLGTSGKPEM
jgi:hypothetical protein